MSSTFSPLRRSLRAIAAVGAVTLLATACSSGGDDGGGGEGVDPGASKSDYAEALKDIDPVKVTVWTRTPPEAGFSKPMEAYKAAVEDWSGGKITIEIAYANSIVDQGTAGEGLADGRVQFGDWALAQKADEFPAANSVARMVLLSGDFGPLAGNLQDMAALSDLFMHYEPALTEYDNAGYVPVFPMLPGPPDVPIICKDQPIKSAADMKGKQIRAGSPEVGNAIKAAGGVPVSLSTAELFEAIERGVIDCAAVDLSVAASTGILDVANQVSYSSLLPITATSHVFNKAFLEGLPLAAQQLLWDRTDVYVETWVHNILSGASNAVKDVRAKGGTVTTWDADLSATMTTWVEGEIDAARQELPGIDDPDAFVDQAEKSFDKWQSIVQDDLGYEVKPYGEIDEWYSSDLDLKPWVEKFMAEALGDHRPGS